MLKHLTRCKGNTLLILHVIKATRIKMKTYVYAMGNFDWSLNIHVWNISRNFLIRVLFYTRNFWYAYHFIHETFDTRIVLYTKLLIRVCFLTWNFSYVESLVLFVHFGQPYKSLPTLALPTARQLDPFNLRCLDLFCDRSTRQRRRNSLPASNLG